MYISIEFNTPITPSVMKHFLFCLLFIITACKSAKEQGNLRSITGTAINEKTGAILISNNEVYLVAGVNKWDSIYLGKEVTVSGNITLRSGEDKLDLKVEGKEVTLAAQMYSQYNIVTNATWQLYNSKTTH